MTGYAGVYPAKSKVRPFVAQIKNERTGKVQSIGSFQTAQQAAVSQDWGQSVSLTESVLIEFNRRPRTLAINACDFIHRLSPCP